MTNPAGFIGGGKIQEIKQNNHPPQNPNLLKGSFVFSGQLTVVEEKVCSFVGKDRIQLQSCAL